MLYQCCAGLTVLAVVLTPAQLSAQADKAPPDTPIAMESTVVACLDSAIAPLALRAQRSLPKFLQRVRRGLPKGQRPAVTTRLRDASGAHEQVFVAIDSVRADTIFGYINNEIHGVQGYRLGQRHTVLKSEVLDWTITRPDGIEEGNLIGKYIDQLVARLRRAPQRRPC